MISYKTIFENNKKWVQEKKLHDHNFFKKLALDQNPEYLYIGCSDSRVTAEELMGAKPGEVFVHRNIANMVVNTDLNTLSVIQYAVEQLRVKHIVVCGHYHCGGIKAALVPSDLGLLNPWLRNIRDVYRLHMDSFKELKTEESIHRKLVKLNVQEQCFNILKIAAVQKAFKQTGFPQVHGWVFDIQEGLLIDLKIDFRKKLEDIMSIYRLED